MKVERAEVSYPEMKPFPEIESLPEIEGEEPEARKKREETHIETHVKAEAVYIEGYKRRKAFFENDSCRYNGCSNTPKAGLKFCRRHVGTRSLLTKKAYNDLGPGIKVKISAQLQGGCDPKKRSYPLLPRVHLGELWEGGE